MAYDKSKGDLYRTNSPYNILRIIKVAHALELKELHQVALEKTNWLPSQILHTDYYSNMAHRLPTKS